MEWQQPIVMGNINETELWIFKDRLYYNLCTVIEEPRDVTTRPPGLFYTVFKDNADICYGVTTNGNPSSSWSYIREVRKVKCGQET
jgi:hypothetical protein